MVYSVRRTVGLFEAERADKPLSCFKGLRWAFIYVWDLAFLCSILPTSFLTC